MWWALFGIRYGPDEGLPRLRDALKKKLYAENGISQSEVMVTAGANQAFANLVVSLVDSEDAVVVFPPFYFNHHSMSNLLVFLGCWCCHESKNLK